MSNVIVGKTFCIFPFIVNDNFTYNHFSRDLIPIAMSQCKQLVRYIN